MIIYKDVVTGDEIISDSYDLKEAEGGVIYEADCKQITIGATNVDIGANASAEEADEGTDDAAQTVIDVIHSFRLTEVPYGTSKEYLGDLKKYMKKVKEALTAKGASADEVKAFETGAAGFAKKVAKNFKDYQFFMGESMDPEGMMVLLNYHDNAAGEEVPYISVWKHGLTEMKV